MKEYGSNVQKLVDHLITVEDREKRTRFAYMLVELMRQIHPNMKDNQDYYNKLWDDLYIMSRFKLDVDSPFPPPSPEALGKKPKQVPYNTHDLRYRHYGRNLELLVEKAIITEAPEERLAFVAYIVRMMKSFYTAWNRDNVDDKGIFQQLREMSDGKLHDELEILRYGGMIDAVPRDRYNPNYNNTNRPTAPVSNITMPNRNQGNNHHRRNNQNNTNNRNQPNNRNNNLNNNNNRRRK